MCFQSWSFYLPSAGTYKLLINLSAVNRAYRFMIILSFARRYLQSLDHSCLSLTHTWLLSTGTYTVSIILSAVNRYLQRLDHCVLINRCLQRLDHCALINRCLQSLDHPDLINSYLKGLDHCALINRCLYSLDHCAFINRCLILPCTLEESTCFTRGLVTTRTLRSRSHARYWTTSAV